jgi:HEPN domain-containing protein
MASTEQTYRDAAKEHLGRAEAEFDRGDYFLSHYLSGLSVECHLRAHLLRNAPQWEPRHDIRSLAKKSGYDNKASSELSSRLSGNIAIIATRWRSNHRYFSEREFLDSMTALRAEFDKRGNRRKNQARTLLNAALEIIAWGEKQW